MGFQNRYPIQKIDHVIWQAPVFMSSIANNFKSDYSKAENIRFLSKVTTQSILWSQVPTENYTWIFVILPWNWYWCSGKSKCHAFSLDDSKLTDMFDQLVRIVKNIELYHILFFLCYFNYYINCDEKKRLKSDDVQTLC